MHSVFAESCCNFFSEEGNWRYYLLTGQKSGFSPRTDSHRFKSNLAGPTGTWVRLAVQFHLNRQRGGNAAPKNIKNFHFLSVSLRRGDFLDRFRKFLVLLYAQLSCISYSNLTWFASQITEYCWETSQLGPIFPCTL